MNKTSKFTEKECSNMDFSKYKLIRSKAIRMKCLDCCGYVEKEVRLCEAKSCPLWSYRMGKAERISTISRSQLKENALKTHNRKEMIIIND